MEGLTTARAAIAYVILFGLFTALLVFAARDSRNAADGQPPADIVLATRGVPQSVGLYGELLESLATAESQQQLEELVTASTRAIVIDRSIAGDLSPDFLARQLAGGVSVFGLNLSERELKTLADWGQAYEMVSGRPRPPADWSDAPPYQTYFTYGRILSNGYGGGLGRLDISAGLFQVRLGHAAGLACRELTPWSECKRE